MSPIFVKVEDLTVKMGSHPVLCDLNLEIPGGKFVAIVGPNGAGKSTLFKVLLGIVKPESGNVRIFDKNVHDVPPEWIGYVPQVKTMDRSFPALSIELVLTGIRSTWPWRPDRNSRETALAALRQVDAEHLAQRSIAGLSGGELQRVCLARSIARSPRLVMLDEPATGIDSVGEADMYEQLETYQRSSGATIIMITHDWHAATHHADLVLLLNKEQISFGAPSDVLTEKNLRRAFGHIGHKHKLDFLRSENA